MELGDGLKFLGEHLEPSVVARILEACTLWIDPKCYALLPTWSPYTYRKAPLFKANWIDRQTNKEVPKHEGNVAASKAQNRYLGIKGRNADTRPNWACCHVWGNDDPRFQSAHAEVNDPRYFTCPANMVLVPSPLKTFTDTIPEVKAALRYAAFLLYGFVPEGRDPPHELEAGDFLPDEWREFREIRYVPMSATIEASIRARYSELLRLQELVGTQYPGGQVTDVANYWKLKTPQSLFALWPGVGSAPQEQ
ncbi:hypothetical protein [Antarctobacter jejuensis]|uniref:hypothetical protein n=1 Tax=Antarctobacter jejuensis TaxID=1439938 RepID=UPI003FD61DA3